MNLTIEYVYASGDVGAYVVEDDKEPFSPLEIAAIELWAGFDLEGRDKPSYLLIRPDSPDGQKLSQRLAYAADKSTELLGWKEVAQRLGMQQKEAKEFWSLYGGAIMEVAMDEMRAVYRDHQENEDRRS